MATHNAEEFIATSLASLLGIDYPNLRIIINDNGSHDRTVQAIRDLTRADSRVTVGAWPDNVGAAKNFNYLLSQARSTYFFWASDHDSWHPKFVSELVEALEGDATAVLAYPQTILVDYNGAEMGLMDDFVDISSTDRCERYRELVWRLTTCNMVYGVMRTAALQATGGFLPLIGTDHLLLARMALRGRFLRVNRSLFWRRDNRREYLALLHDSQAQLARIAGPSHAKPTDVGSLYRELRDEHLKLVREELHGRDRLRAEITTRRAFLARFGVRDPLAAVASTGVRLLAKAGRAALLAPRA